MLLGSPNTPVDSTAIFDGGSTIRSRRQLLQIIDTTLLKCYLKVRNLNIHRGAFAVFFVFYLCPMECCLFIFRPMNPWLHPCCA